MVSQIVCRMLKIVPGGILAVSQTVCLMLKIVPTGILAVSQKVCPMLKMCTDRYSGGVLDGLPNA